jgi:subtilisin-like proprotein convertase family protein
MSKEYDIYTYRAGKKVRLRKSKDELIVRQTPEKLPADVDFRNLQQVSSASTRITTDTSRLEQVMSRARAIAPAHHAYYEEAGDSPFLITDRIFCSFHTPPTDDQLNAFTSRYALVLLERYGDRDFLFQLTNHTGMNPVKLVVRLNEQDDSVDHAEHDMNHHVYTSNLPLPTDPDYIRQWHLHTHFNHADYDHRSCARCEDAWKLLDNYGSNTITIAITDDGCRLDHSDFDSPGKFPGWAYFRGDRLITSDDIDADPDEMYKQGSNHGTSCAGVAAGEVDASLVVGAAPGCRLLPVQWESSGPSLYISSSRMLKVLDYLAGRADIVSNSWGTVPVNVWPAIVVDRIRQLALTGGPRGKGILFCWAAGNEDCPINADTDIDVPYTHGVEVQGGALVWVGVQTARHFENNLVGIPGVMHVAACASTAQRSHYSNYGPGIGISAPSSNSHTYYRMLVHGLGITTTTGATGAVTDSFGGTSSATPLVAGIAALVLSANTALSALDVASMLKRKASRNVDFQGYPRTEPTSYDPDTSWDVSPVAPYSDGSFTDTGSEDGTCSMWYGCGLVDARAAVAGALALGTTTGPAYFIESSTPNVSIPDNNADGISDTINCGKNFTVDTVAVRVDITHTYIGDLAVNLESPAGTTVPLHYRTGANTHDIHVDYTVQNKPELHGFTGENSLGQWRLGVRDLASADTGRLQSWSIQLRGGDVEEIIASESPGLIIPDNQIQGIVRTLNIGTDRNVGHIRVFVDITHSYANDLILLLRAPDGSEAVLVQHNGSQESYIIQEFNDKNTAALQSLISHPAQGDWELQVIDDAEFDQGKLNHWYLAIA